MNRRGFLAMLGGVALSEAIPLGRVWSFPSKIVIAHQLPWDIDVYDQIIKTQWLTGVWRFNPGEAERRSREEK